MKAQIYIAKSSLVAAMVLFTLSASPQGLLNNGGKITLSSGANITLTGSTANFVNASQNGDGTVDNDGTINLQANFTNSATGGSVFINANTQGIVEFNGSTAGNITGSVSFENLTMNNAAGVTLQNNNSISNSLSLTNGLFSLNGKTLSIANDAIIYKTGGNLSTTPAFAGQFDVEYDQYGSQIETGYELPDATDKIRDLIINNTNGVLLEKDITVNRKITFNNGKFDIFQHVLKLAPEAIITGFSSSKYIIAGGADYESEGGRLSRFIKDTTAESKQFFPIGTATSYTPCYVSTNHTTGTYFKVNLFDKVLDYGTNGNEVTTLVVKRTWDIKPDDQAMVGSASVKLFWNTSDEPADFNRSAVTIWKNRHLAGTDEMWNELTGNLTGQIVTAPYWVAIDGINSFSHFAISSKLSGNSPLPMSLVSFTASCEGIKKILLWTTATETNNDRFTIEHSPDAIHWEYVTDIAGAGNSNSLLHYTATDSKPYNSTTYYRLKQTDFNGNYSYSGIITSEKCSTSEASIDNVYPNPFRDNVSVNFSSAEEGQVTIEVVSEKGDKVYSKPVSVSIGQNITMLNLSSLRKGNYIVYLSCDPKRFFKIAKQ
jgi:hypothetical protein